MRKKEKTIKAWKEICNNCNRHKVNFYGVFSAVFENPLPYLDMYDEPCDQFSLAIFSKDINSIEELYKKTGVYRLFKNKIKPLLLHNKELLVTLNPYILQDKYNFLEPYIDVLSLDRFYQDLLLSLDDFELSILERLVNLAQTYNINSEKLISKFLLQTGRSTLELRNNEKALARVTTLFNLIKEYQKENPLDDETINHIGYMIISGIHPDNIENLKNYNDTIKDLLKKLIDQNNDIDVLKDNLLYYLFVMNKSDAQNFIDEYNLDGLPKELESSDGVIEYQTIKMILDCIDINKLKEIVQMIIDDKDFKINIFNNGIVEENLLSLYADEFNKCTFNIEDLEQIDTVDNIKIYDSGYNFYAIVKSLGAFSEDGKSNNNYSVEWNDDRYRSHINAVSLIRNDNLAFAETDGKLHIKIGFNNFKDKMLLGGGVKDINSTPDSREMGNKIYSSLCLPNKFINSTRWWHNELSYERKDLDPNSNNFKKNPSFVILDQECEDIKNLSIEKQKEFEEYKNNTLKAAKDFGNIPIVVINREKIAKNEINQINLMLNEYVHTNDYNILKNIVIKFNNNRNGCRGPQHEYIRNNYFSDDYFQNLLNEIDNIIINDQRDDFFDFIKEENTIMRRCTYDNTTKSIPVVPSYLEKGVN